MSTLGFLCKLDDKRVRNRIISMNLEKRNLANNLNSLDDVNYEITSIKS